MAGSLADIAGIYRDVKVGGPDVTPPMHARLALHPNVPNPFNPHTTLSFTLPVAGLTRLEIYDLRGRRVRTLASGQLDSGPTSGSGTGRTERGVPWRAGCTPRA